MDNLFIRSVSAEALRAELNRHDLLREAANNRLASGASSRPTSRGAPGRIRSPACELPSPAWAGPPRPTARTASNGPAAGRASAQRGGDDADPLFDV